MGSCKIQNQTIFEGARSFSLKYGRTQGNGGKLGNLLILVSHLVGKML